MSATVMKRKNTMRKVTISSVENIMKETLTAIDKAENEKQFDKTVVAYRETLLDKSKRVSEYTDELFNLFEKDEDIANLENDDTKFTLYFKTNMIKINDFIDKYNTDKSSDTSSTSGSSSHAVRLPKLEIKPFDGNIENWQEFWDSFSCTVDDNESLSGIQKMTYLKNLIRGTASTTISGFKLTNENYTLAVNLLKERYNNKQLLVSSHVNNLLKIEPIQSLKEVYLLRDLYNKVETQIRSLQNLDIDSKNYGPLLIPMLLSKIPQELNLIISRKFTNDDSWDISLVLDALKSELIAREKTNFSFEQHLDSNISAASLHISSKADLQSEKKNSDRNKDKSENKRSLSCIFCGREHKPHQCQIVTNIDSRKSILKEKRRCFNCLKGGHLAKKCTSKIKCFKCSGTHHLAVCTVDSNENKQEEVEKTHNGVSSISSTSVLLQTAQVKVVNNKNLVNARVLLDNGSQLSYCTPELRKRLNLKTIDSREICIRTFGGIVTTEKLERVKLEMKTTNGEKLSIQCYVKEICHPLTSQNTKFALDKYPHLKNLKLADVNFGDNISVDILIGSDYYWSIINDKIIRGDENQPIAIESKFGYILSGPIRYHSSDQSKSTLISHVLKCQTEVIDRNIDLNDTLSRFWEIETFGLDDPLPDDKFQPSIEFLPIEKRYNIKFPFKEEHDLLPDNYVHCVQRLKSLSKKFSHNPELLESYNDIIKEQISTGVIETVPDEESADYVGQVHYLPHRPVVRNDRSTTKVRMVFDASCNKTGPSLNDCLYTGPSLTESLFGVMLRFRQYRYAFISDIEKAFLQISIDKEHRDFVRFLWFKNFDELNSDNIQNSPLQIYRLCRVLFGVTSSPSILASTIIEHINKSDNKTFVNKFLKSLHVDDLNSGGETIEEVYQFYTEAKNTLSEASFNLRKFQSNSTELDNLVQSDMNSSFTTKILGLTWDKKKDCFVFSFSHLLSLAFEKPTKRQLIQFFASLYDPLGLLNPYVVKLKILFQKVCAEKTPWDSFLSESSLEQWKLIRQDLHGSRELFVDRWFHFSSQVIKIEVHGFSDACLDAYGGCVYVKVFDDMGHISSSLVAAKSRVAPLKSLTIPKLELCGALLLAELIVRVIHELSEFVSLEAVHCWIDSMVTLHWICGVEKRHPRFVQNRVDKIRSLVPSSHWFHINTSLNPADILSRGAFISQLTDNKLWFNGPGEIMLSSELDVNKFSLNNLMNTATLSSTSEENYTAENEEKKNFINLQEVLTMERFDSYNKLTRVLAYVLRFITNLKSKIKQLTVLTIEELNDAEKLIIKDAQRDIETKPSYKQLCKDLRLIKDNDGIIRCKGRLENAPLPFESKFPIFLPKGYLANLIVIKFHRSVLHNGVKETLNQLRTKYWIPKARNFIRNIIKKCHLCNKFEGKPFMYPETPAIPAHRLSMSPPFTYTALDYAGPVYVKDIYHDANVTYKAWIFLYTCSSTRSLCLDLVPDYSAPTCIRGLRRFFSRRGTPLSILSDNGSNFTATETQDFVTNLGIKWQFNPPASPWWGGVFERLIRSVKRCLRKVLLTAKLTYEEFLTVLYEIEIILNNRPLTFTYENPSDEVLTPNHLLFGRRLNLFSSNEVIHDHELNNSKRYNYIQNILSHFWKRWRFEYVTELREHHNASIKSSGNISCNIGDVVLIHEDKVPRATFKVGIVEDFKNSRDGQRRVAVVQYLNNDHKRTRIQRPLNKLYLLEGQNRNDVEVKFIDENNIIVFGP